MRVAVIGYGVEGKSSATYWAALGNEVIVLDRNEQAEIDASYSKKLGEGYLDNLGQYDLVVRSAGVHPKDLVGAKLISSQMIEFFEQCPAKIIGVSGTKGKSTTASLIAHILEATGKKVWLGGNIGIPVLDFLLDVKSDDFVVLEMSNFQLIDMRHSPNIAVLLRVGEDHLDFHADLAEYTNTKLNLYKHQKTADLAIYRANDDFASKAVELSQADTKIPFGIKNLSKGAYLAQNKLFFNDIEVISASEVPLLGVHNLENCTAAIAATYDLVGDTAKIAAQIASFKSLRHRLEKVVEIDGVSFYDDSIATNPDTTIAAINSFEEPKVLILGGSDKGHNYANLATKIANSNVKYVVLMGQMAPKIASSLEIAHFTSFEHATDMADAVQKSAKNAKNGDIVLLSPACASFGMFTNYADRGDQFAAAVQNLKL